MTTATDAKYATRSVKTVRGLESRTRTKLENEGWEFVSQTQGKVTSELIFRRRKPEIPWKLVGIGGGLLALLAIVITIITALGGGDSSGNAAEPVPTQSATQALVPEAATPSAVLPEAATPSAASTIVSPKITTITVDDLLDKLNSAKLGGIKNGDQFQLTGELFMSDLWTTGVTGEFSVMLKAQGGAQDLRVFVDKSEASKWRDGTKVHMVLESGEATINGETTDGWLRVVSAETIP